MRSRTGSGRPANRGHLRRRRSALPRVIERAEVRADAASRSRGAGRPATPVRDLLHRRRFVRARGVRGLCLMVWRPMPWGGVGALPFLTVLAPSERYAHARGQRHKKVTAWARQALLQTARWLPGRRVVAVADSSFSAIDLMRAISRRLCIVTRLRRVAARYVPSPVRQPSR